MEVEGSRVASRDGQGDEGVTEWQRSASGSRRTTTRCSACLRARPTKRSRAPTRSSRSSTTRTRTRETRTPRNDSRRSRRRTTCWATRPSARNTTRCGAWLRRVSVPGDTAASVPVAPAAQAARRSTTRATSETSAACSAISSAGAGSSGRVVGRNGDRISRPSCTCRSTMPCAGSPRPYASVPTRRARRVRVRARRPVRHRRHALNATAVARSRWIRDRSRSPRCARTAADADRSSPSRAPHARARASRCAPVRSRYACPPAWPTGSAFA